MDKQSGVAEDSCCAYFIADPYNGFFIAGGCTSKDIFLEPVFTEHPDGDNGGSITANTQYSTVRDSDQSITAVTGT